ncbi:hypothetical protein IBX73_10110 [candidate division WOR-3 bacterium]|nr:hypothetical protein [candidate division WOR-3 bacterium]
MKAVVNAGPYALNAIINEGVFTEVRLDRIIWRIAEREGIVSADMTIDLDARHGKVRSKFDAIDMFVKAVDKPPTHLPEIYKKDIYKEWYEIYKRETPWYVYKE